MTRIALLTVWTPEMTVAEDSRFRLLLAAVQRAKSIGDWNEVERLRERLHQVEHEILVEIAEGA